MNVFIAWDGDHIGRQVGRASLADDAEGLRRISQAIDHGNTIWKSWVESHGGSIVSMGGDEGRAEIPADYLDELPKIREQYKDAVNSPVSVGIGNKLSEADQALVAAKLRGGDRVEFYTEEVAKLIEEARAKGEKTEEQKIADEYLNKAAPAMHPGAFSGAVRPSAATVDKPTPTQGEHSEAQVAADTQENSGVSPELTHAADDFEAEFHDAARAQELEDNQKQAAQTKNIDGVKQKIVQALQILKQQAPIMEQIKQSAPDAYAAMVGLAQAVVQLSQVLSPPQQMQKAEVVVKPSRMKGAMKDPRGTFVYRVQGPTGRGPYHFEGPYDEAIKHHYMLPSDTLTGGGSQHGLMKPTSEMEKPNVQPGPGPDFEFKEWYGVPAEEKKQFHFGFESPEHARAWFGNESLEAMKRQGYELQRVPATKVFRSTSGRQVIYKPDYESWATGLPAAPVKKSEVKNNIVNSVRSVLTRDLLDKKHQNAPEMATGNSCTAGHCYAGSEALQYLLGGKEAGWDPQVVHHEGGTHWYLKHRHTGEIIDPTSDQFATPPPYHLGRTVAWVRHPSMQDLPTKRAQQIIERVLSNPMEKSMELEPAVMSELIPESESEGASEHVENMNKMAIADIKPGKLVGKGAYDYTHVLPESHQQAGYKMVVWPTGANQHRAEISLGGKTVGYLGFQGPKKKSSKLQQELKLPPASMLPRSPETKDVEINNSFLEEPHRGKGLGLPMYEAAYSYAKHKLGATHVKGEEHSTSAGRVHQALARKHGMFYQPHEDSMEADEHEAPFDGRYYGYKYAIKGELPAKKEYSLIEDGLSKMAIADIPSGKMRNDGRYDYTHVLPESHRAAGYAMNVNVIPMELDDNQTGWRTRANVTHHGMRVGTVEGFLRPDSPLMITNSDISREHRGKGLGVPMYEALYAHAKHSLGATHVGGKEHSTSAGRLHQALSRKHGLEYKPEHDNGPGELGELPFDGRYHGYNYAIKGEMKTESDPDEKYDVTEDGDLEKSGLPMPKPATRHHLNLPVGSQVANKIKVQHSDGHKGWVQVGSGEIMSQDPSGHPVSSRNPGGK